MTASRLLVVGSTGGSHIGGSLVRAAPSLGLEAEICNMQNAWHHGSVSQKFLWRFCGRRPIALEKFSQGVVEKCRLFQPEIMLTTGMAPVTEAALAQSRKLGVRCINFSTDDPFNPQMHSPWFLRALRQYDSVFSPRTANQQELRLHGCRRVEYLPFGYDETLFFSEPNVGAEETSDLFFAGTGDRDRLLYIRAATEAGFCVRLHGNYWRRYRATRRIARGQADISTLRKGIASCKVALCLVRHENRDGHSMRSFEVPAVGACMVVEDTLEHRQIFGEDGGRVVYFKTAGEMVERVRMLLANEILRKSLRDNVHLHITNGANTYADRLRTMINAL
jgi:spore maturation protein CgeB